jgi:hypothetical protein
MKQVFELVGGPQDGAKVRRIGELMPQVIYVGKKWQGDRYAAWGTKASKRFPVCYVLDNSLKLRYFGVKE